MAKKREFLISTANVAFYYNNVLAFTGKTSLNTSFTVSMQDKEITGGQLNKLLYKMKYGRKIACSIEMAEWQLSFIAANAGTKIATALKDVFSIAECVTLTSGVGTLAKTPVAGTKVYVEKSDGSIVEITPVGSTITVGTENGTVNATYQFNERVRRVTIDTDSVPFLGKLVMSAQRHNNSIGKVGEVQIEVPSFQVSGNFDIALSADGNTTTKIDGDALSVESDSCEDGDVYAYITEIDDTPSTVSVSEIVATPANPSIAVAGTQTITVVGVKGGMYSNIALTNTECTFTSGTPATATVSTAGVITGVGAGTSVITIAYGDLEDTITVTVTA